VLLCEHHHHAAHDGRFTIILHAPGVITIRARSSRQDPYYEIRLKAPPPTLNLTEKLQTAAGFARAGNED
jgi:hypothetical protein